MKEVSIRVVCGYVEALVVVNGEHVGGRELIRRWGGGGGGEG